MKDSKRLLQILELLKEDFDQEQLSARGTSETENNNPFWTGYANAMMSASMKVQEMIYDEKKKANK